MHTLNIRVSNTQSQIELVYNLHKDSLDNILNSNIDKFMAKFVFTKLELLRQGIAVTQSYMP